MKKFLVLLITAPVLTAALLFSGCGKSAQEEALNTAFEKSKNIKNARAEFEAEVSIKGLEGAGGELPLRLRGSVDSEEVDGKASARGNVRLEGLGDLSGSIRESGQDLGVLSQAAGFIGTLTAFDFVAAGDKTYLNLGGTWYEVDESDLSMIGLGAMGGMGPATGGEDSECFQKALDDPERFSLGKMLKGEQALEDESIDGVNTRHYRASLDVKHLLDEAQEVIKECGDAESAGAFEASRSNLEKLLKKVDFEFWVDSDDHFRQVKVDAALDMATFGDVARAFGGPAGAAPAGSLDVGITATVKMSRFGESFDIRKPEKVVPFEEFTAKLIGMALGGISIPGGTGGATTTPATTTPTSSTTAAPAAR